MKKIRPVPDLCATLAKKKPLQKEKKIYLITAIKNNYGYDDIKATQAC